MNISYVQYIMDKLINQCSFPLTCIQFLLFYFLEGVEQVSNARRLQEPFTLPRVFYPYEWIEVSGALVQQFGRVHSSMQHLIEPASVCKCLWTRTQQTTEERQGASYWQECTGREVPVTDPRQRTSHCLRTTCPVPWTPLSASCISASTRRVWLGGDSDRGPHAREKSALTP